MHLDKDYCPFFPPVPELKQTEEALLLWCTNHYLCLSDVSLLYCCQNFHVQLQRISRNLVFFKAKAAAEEVPTHFPYLHSVLSGNAFL